MHVLVTGATGMVGRALVERLHRAGHNVIAWVRDVARARQRLGDAIELVSDAGGHDALAHAVARADAVVNLAGENIAEGRWTKKRKRALRESRLALTSRLVEALAQAAPRPRVLVNASAIGYYGDRGGELVDESASPGDDFLARLSRDWEQSAEIARAHGVRVVRLRIGVVLNRDGGALAKMLPFFRAGLGGPLGSGRQYFAWIHLHDLIAIALRALEDERMQGPYNATAPAPVTNAELARAIGRALHRPSFVPVPSPMLRLALGELAGSLLASCRATPARLLAAGFHFSFPDIDGALADLLATKGASGARDREPRR